MSYEVNLETSSLVPKKQNKTKINFFFLTEVIYVHAKIKQANKKLKKMVQKRRDKSNLPFIFIPQSSDPPLGTVLPPRGQLPMGNIGCHN